MFCKLLVCHRAMEDGCVYRVTVLKEGYSYQDDSGQFHADGTITLVQGRHVILVDTGGPQDKGTLLQQLSSHGLTPRDVQYVVCTHGHVDHVGNLNLFPDATHIVSFDICKGDVYTDHPFRQGAAYTIDEQVSVIPTPGHTGADVSVVVKTATQGTVVIAGDLFEKEADLTDPSLWQDVSENPSQQAEGRRQVLAMADFIVPGHGAMFKVQKETEPS
ncbi:PREDICTED: metallo-beta-lactamase domain-containing protein 1-like isoform X1 [Branchiostoma belcheri]|uniref:Metallo-beta-lactamase domain-containing protein 1 n=2 Tax=Branchiostoma belcheri TaxID=7741 RepID=A0A6P5AGR2_BRABE|nr:PREDICTED: metallo-beta-lactamase domain-containing protein 1-like isoform X1 [Branchiostoma belcheri]